MFNKKLVEVKDTFGKQMKRHTGTELNMEYKYVYVASYNGKVKYKAELSKYCTKVRDVAVA